jgi:hypothetical protein
LGSFFNAKNENRAKLPIFYNQTTLIDNCKKYQLREYIALGYGRIFNKFSNEEATLIIRILVQGRGGMPDARRITKRRYSEEQEIDLWRDRFAGGAARSSKTGAAKLPGESGSRQGLFKQLPRKQ